jgi:hypothetical protein
MAWVALSTTDIKNSLTAQEQSGMSPADFEADLTTIVQSVTALVRGKVNAFQANRGHLGPPGTIPDELYAAAIAISRFKYLTHLPGTQLITVDRRTENEEGIAQLDNAADGKLYVIRGDDMNEQSPMVNADSGGSGSDLRYGPNPFVYPYALSPDSDPYW